MNEIWYSEAFWWGVTFGAMGVMLALSVLAAWHAGARLAAETPEYLPPEGGSVMSRPTVGSKGGTGVPPKRCCRCCRCCVDD